MMNLSIYAHEAEVFLRKFREDPTINISSAHLSSIVRKKLQLTGRERRSFTEEEVDRLLAHYSYFRTYFIRKGLWIDRADLHCFFRGRIILHIPHASTRIPMYDGYKVSESRLRKENILHLDCYTHDLFRHPDATPIIAGFSRIFCDVERFPDDSMEIMAKKGMGALYEKLDSGKPLRKITPALRTEIIKNFYEPHHRRLKSAVEKQLAQYGKALILDCHSFPDIPFQRDLNQDPGRPDYNLGIDEFHTSGELLELAKQFFISRNLSVGINTPYSGSIVPIKYYRKNKNVRTIMLEVNRNLNLRGN